MKGRIVMVTGAARGIGRATVDMLVDAGATVIGTDLQIEDTKPERERLRFLSHDISSEESWQSVLANVLAREGRLDALVNNAGVALGAPMTKISLEDWRWVMSVNLDGTFLGVKHALRLMRSDGGAIVNVSSSLALVGRPYTGAVAASKAGILAITRTAASEAARFEKPVRVNAVLPGGVDTEIFRDQSWWPDHKRDPQREDIVRADIVKDTPLGRLASPDEVAASIVFLCSEKASFITGECLTVDGGFTSS